MSGWRRVSIRRTFAPPCISLHESSQRGYSLDNMRTRREYMAIDEQSLSAVTRVDATPEPLGLPRVRRGRLWANLVRVGYFGRDDHVAEVVASLPQHIDIDVVGFHPRALIVDVVIPGTEVLRLD